MIFETYSFLPKPNGVAMFSLSHKQKKNKQARRITKKWKNFSNHQYFFENMKRTLFTEIQEMAKDFANMF